MSIWRSLGLAAAMLLASFPLYAAPADSGPIRIIVTGPAGGTVDTIARVFANTLPSVVPNAVPVVENLPGGSGVIAVRELLKSPKNGSTLLIGTNAFASEAPHIVRMPVDPLKALTPVTDLARSGLVFVAGNSVPVSTFQEALTYARQHPGKTQYASFGLGTQSHILGVELNRTTGLDMVHVAYKGSPPALTDIMGGHVQFMFDGPATSLPFLKTNRLKALATTAPQRLSSLPNVPTFAELGYPKLTQVVWIGLWVASGTSPEVSAQLRNSAMAIVQSPAFRKKIAEIGMEPPLGVPMEELAAQLSESSRRHAQKLKEIGYVPD
ncbi:tripartite tricarboxylate transporter substrate binding protein [Cupriavidus oxalaticus]|uniref:Bug family tripartite tricarboxylate transporter substrate binding protein n=1 Tax=Cupriavidus oxalaticus TaxID=96344 RepID=UPI00316F0529